VAVTDGRLFRAAAQTDVAGELQREELLVDPDSATVAAIAVFACAQVEDAMAIVAGRRLGEEGLAADVADDYEGRARRQRVRRRLVRQGRSVPGPGTPPPDALRLRASSLHHRA